MVIYIDFLHTKDFRIFYVKVFQFYWKTIEHFLELLMHLMCCENAQNTFILCIEKSLFNIQHLERFYKNNKKKYLPGNNKCV